MMKVKMSVCIWCDKQCCVSIFNNKFSFISIRLLVDIEVRCVCVDIYCTRVTN